MKIVEQSHEIIQIPDNPLLTIESAGRTCYKSQDKMTDESSIKFSEKLLRQNHESVFEHAIISVRFITNRGVTHELVRHRLCSFSQESTRYVKYDNGNMEFIKPVWWADWTSDQQNLWKASLENAENTYVKLLELGTSPEKAREVLPNSLKTEIVVTANLREWRHIFNLRCRKISHPQIRQLMINCCKEFRSIVPVLFDKIELND